MGGSSSNDEQDVVLAPVHSRALLPAPTSVPVAGLPEYRHRRHGSRPVGGHRGRPALPEPVTVTNLSRPNWSTVCWAWYMSKPAVPRHRVAATPDGTASRREDRQLRGARVVAGSGHGGLERHALRSADVGCLLLFGGTSGKRPTRAWLIGSGLFLIFGKAGRGSGDCCRNRAQPLIGPVVCLSAQRVLHGFCRQAAACRSRAWAVAPYAISARPIRSAGTRRCRRSLRIGCC